MTLLTRYGAHVVAYTFSLLTLLVGLPPQAVALLGPHGNDIVGIAGILLTAADNIHKIIAAPNPTALPAPEPATVVKTPIA